MKNKWLMTLICICMMLTCVACSQTNETPVEQETEETDDLSVDVTPVEAVETEGKFSVVSFSPADFSSGSLSGIAVDGDGLLISDVFNKIIWRADSKEITLHVGQISIPGLDGEPIGKYDDGTLDTALFMEPWAITPFREGFLVTDSKANVVRYFDDKAVYTAVGNGKAGKKDAFGIEASFNNPTGLATDDNGNVYIADTGNGSIRVMDKEGNVSTLISDLIDPTGLCWYQGSLYVAETGRNRIVKVTGKQSEVIAGITDEMNDDGYYQGGYEDGSLDKASFDHPQGVAVGPDGAIYVADTGNQAVRKIHGEKVTTLAVSKADSIKPPVQPRSILVYEDTLYVTDLFAQMVLTLDADTAGTTHNN